MNLVGPFKVRVRGEDAEQTVKTSLEARALGAKLIEQNPSAVVEVTSREYIEGKGGRKLRQDGPVAIYRGDLA